MELDLDWRWHQKALDYGCNFSIKPDAHSIKELDHMHWGVEKARKGGVPPNRVLNAMPLAKRSRHLQRRRQTASRAAERASETGHMRQNERGSSALPAFRRGHRSSAGSFGRSCLPQQGPCIVVNSKRSDY
jgi:hypothetical protein